MQQVIHYFFQSLEVLVVTCMVAMVFGNRVLRYAFNSGITIADEMSRALQPFNTFWHEDAIRMDSLDLLKQYARDCDALIRASEILSCKRGFKDHCRPGWRAW